ncbi:hypothetical protein HPB51_005676 [Rhipicephalus microplus]|uniref:Uncharacterized protein n=1 Tax=Rhipicephalus microplus TaxID=6941 RepID=A0A9J6EY58_RHIMP|nr:hypothetical protein HPB51_005676 [Rhipicephalus microplus]
MATAQRRRARRRPLSTKAMTALLWKAHTCGGESRAAECEGGAGSGRQARSRRRPLNCICGGQPCCSRKHNCHGSSSKKKARLSALTASMAGWALALFDGGLRRLRCCRYSARASARRCRLAESLLFERPEDLLDGPELFFLVVALRGCLETRQNRF